MDIKAYISSGIIESYVLGIASAEEVRELEELCVQHPEIRDALLEVQEGMEQFAKLNGQAPPSASRESIFQALVKEELIAMSPEGDSVEQAGGPKPIPFGGGKRKSPNVFAYIAAACIALLILGSFYHFRTVNKLKTELLLLASQQRILSAELTGYREEADTLRQQLAIVAKPGMRKLELAGVAGHESNAASLYWDADTKQVYLLPSKLAALPAGKQYQLWAIVGGKPVSAGVFTQSSLASIQQMETIQQAEMFAITIEKEGGAEAPTLSQMVVASKI